MSGDANSYSAIVNLRCPVCETETVTVCVKCATKERESEARAIIEHCLFMGGNAEWRDRARKWLGNPKGKND